MCCCLVERKPAAHQPLVEKVAHTSSTMITLKSLSTQVSKRHGGYHQPMEVLLKAAPLASVLLFVETVIFCDGAVSGAANRP